MFEEWALLELMGHRKLAGKVIEETIANHSFIRIDIYSSNEKIELTQYYNATAIYSMTPISKDAAIAFSKRNIPVPITQWELLPEQQDFGGITGPPEYSQED